MSSGVKRKNPTESSQMPAPKRARNLDSIEFNYLLLDPDYQPIAIGVFASGDLEQLSVPFVEERLSKKHEVTVGSLRCVSVVGFVMLARTDSVQVKEEDQLDVKSLHDHKNPNQDWRMLVEKKSTFFSGQILRRPRQKSLDFRDNQDW